MLESLLGSVNREKVLLFIRARGEGYPREISKFFNTDLSPIQNQLEKLETGGILYSRLVGKTRLYAFNPRYSFLTELNQLLDKALSFYPKKDYELFFMNRKRPRRKNKPL